MNVLNQDGEVYLIQNWLSDEEADKYFEALKKQIVWKQEMIRMFDKQLPCPRMTAWYSDKGMDYTYSGIPHEGQGWLPVLRQFKDKLEQQGYLFNSVLCNYYQDGSKSIGWHADNEKELGESPTIASLSLGAERPLKFKHKYSGLIKKIILPHGSLLLMLGATQSFWLHALPKVNGSCKERINLTFRTIIKQKR